MHCKKKAHVDFIIITISDKGIISSYKNRPLIFCPQIIKTKTINKQKDLSILRDKFKHNSKISPYDCSLMIALPLFKTKENEAEITEEMCRYIKEKKDCIPDGELENMTAAMYLNIIEYVGEDKQEELMGMIGLAEKIEGIISDIENAARKDGEKKGRKEGEKKGRKDIINRLLEKYTEDEVSKLLGMKKVTLFTILQE